MRNGWLAAIIAALALSLPGFAQQEAPAEAGNEAADETSADAPEAGSEPEAEGAAEARRAAADAVDDFVPTEEVPPDEEVVFPVDI